MTKTEFSNSKGLKIAGILDLPEDKQSPFPAVIALHGFGANKESNSEWSEILNPLGIAVLRIDFQGTGESDGKYEDKTLSGFLDDALSALDHIYNLPEINKEKIGIVGHSMGGTTAILLAATDPRIKTLIASVPAINPYEVIANLFEPEEIERLNAKGYAEGRKNGNIKRLNYQFFTDAKIYNIIKEAKKIPYPFLVIGATHDHIAPFKQVQQLCTNVPNAKLLTLPNSDHDLENDWPIAEKEISKWFTDWLKEEYK